MTKRIMLMTAAVALPLTAVGHADWRMTVHSGGLRTEYAAAEVDSVTFYNLPQTVLVPSGSYLMGDGLSLCGTSQHEVTLTRTFELGVHEVTNQEYLWAAQWAYDHGLVQASANSVWDDLDGSDEELLDLDGDCEIAFSAGRFSLRDIGHGTNPDHPVKEVTWYGAVRFCDWLSLQAGLPRAYQHGGDWACNGGDPYGAAGYRLPTDAEWEYAAQFDDERAYPWGDDAPSCALANYRPSSYCVGWTAAVGGYVAAPSELGLLDMAGNIGEWCNDWHVCDLGSTPEIDPAGPVGGTIRVLRGGSWIANAGSNRCAYRYPGADGNPSVSLSCLGFRVAKTVVP